MIFLCEKILFIEIMYIDIYNYKNMDYEDDQNNFEDDQNNYEDDQNEGVKVEVEIKSDERKRFVNGLATMFKKLIMNPISKKSKEKIQRKPMLEMNSNKSQEETRKSIPGIILENTDKTVIKSVAKILFKNDIIVEFKENGEISTRYCYNSIGKPERCDGEGSLPTSEKDLTLKMLDLLTTENNEKLIEQLADEITRKIREKEQGEQREIIIKLQKKLEQLNKPTSTSSEVKDILGQIILQIILKFSNQVKK